MDERQLLVDLHCPNLRQGPGDLVQTRLALELSGISERSGINIADVGCGTGASTIALAQQLGEDITAVDFLPEFLAELMQRAETAGVAERVTTLNSSMENLPFEDSSLDLIWSEGAIYCMGFENGINAWRRFLKPGGVLAVSELTWLTASRPDTLNDYWNREYPEVAPASVKIAQLENAGYRLRGYFPLPKHCWLENYYRPLQERFQPFLEAHNNSNAAKAIVEETEIEISLYERYSDYVSYGFYIAEKLEADD